MKQTNNYQSKIQNSLDENEIDLKLIFNILFRNRLLIISLTGLFFIISCLYAILKPRTWEGQFQIVLNSGNEKGSFNTLLTRGIASRLGLARSDSSDLLTQVGILKSQSVLMPIFDFVNNESKKIDLSQDDLIFSNWKKNLKTDLEKDTKILNIVYQDTNKDIIIPVLKMISQEYKLYSGRKRKKSLTKTKDYLKSQIEIYKNKSLNSLKSVQEFANDQDLTLLDMGSFKSYKLKAQDQDQEQKKPIFSNMDIENKRIEASNQIRIISKQIEKIQELENNPQQLQYFGSTISGLNEQGLPIKLEAIESDLANLRNIYTEKDPKIKRLLKRRENAIKLLKERSINYLKAKRKSFEAQKESTLRPKGVILKYKSLLREAIRDEMTLINLEDQMKATSLESEIKSDPWELITKPTLNQLAVGPNKKTIGMAGLISGLFISSILAIWKEKKSGLIYDKKELENITNTKIVREININFGKIEGNKYQGPLIELLKDETNLINIIPTTNIKTNDIKIIREYFESISENILNLNIKNLSDNIKDSENIFLVTNLKLLTYREIYELKNRFQLLNKDLKGIILID